MTALWVEAKFNSYTTLESKKHCLLTLFFRSSKEEPLFNLTFFFQEFNLYQMPVTLIPPDHPDKPVIDVPLHLVFLCFPIEELLKLLSCVLLEERIVFLSSNYALLAIIAEVGTSI